MFKAKDLQGLRGGGSVSPHRSTDHAQQGPVEALRHLRGSNATESQNRRMVGVGRALCGSPSPTPCPSRVTQSRLHRTASRRVLNISREQPSQMLLNI